MKTFYSSFFFFLLTCTAVAQTSQNEKTGDWITPSGGTSVWTGPDPCTQCENKETITIRGTVTHYGDIIFDNNATLTIESDGGVPGNYVGDTLIIVGSLTIKNTAILKVGAGAVLIVAGNFVANNNLALEANGSIVVGGDFTAENNATIDNSAGMLYVGGTFDSGNNLTLTDEQKGVGDMNTLKTNDLPLYDFVEQYLNLMMPVLLPVELLYFKASNGSQGVKVEWASAKEWNFSHYTIERSEDGKTFTPIHTVQVNGDSHTKRTYSFLDTQPNFGTNYYRLKATDIDETVAYKGMALAYSGTKGELQVYPNPASEGMFTIKNSGAIQGTLISIYNVNGREILKMQMPEAELRIPVSELSVGMYIVKIENHLETKQTRLIIR